MKPSMWPLLAKAILPNVGQPPTQLQANPGTGQT